MLSSVLAATLALASPSAPPPPGGAFELEWNAPATCPKVVRVRELVTELVPPEQATATRLRVISTVEQVPGGFEGSLELIDGDRRTTRALFAEDCMLLARATAVVVAVSFDPIATVEELRVGPQDPPEDANPSVPSSPHRPSPHRPSSRDDRASDEPDARPSGRADSLGGTRPSGRVELGARLGVGLGGLLLPAPGVGLSLSPFLGTARVHVRANLQYWAPQRVALDDQRDATGELQLVTAGLRLCPQLQRDRVRIPLCAGVDAGAMLGRGLGRDLTASHAARQPWLGAVLQPGVALDVTSRISLWLALEGVLSLYLPRFAIEGASRGFTAGPGDLRGLLGVELHARRRNP